MEAAKAPQPERKEGAVTATKPHHNQPDQKTAAPKDYEVNEKRTHFGYDWTVAESVLYNKPGKSKSDYTESLYATNHQVPEKSPGE